MIGDRVVVSKGKYGGKEGRIKWISRDVVTVIEDVSNLEVILFFDLICFVITSS